ncbi:interferon-induced protein 44-like [Mya arenaria]|nr:interferon-induced protein 44-like [Mya arenaria]XP_052787780.1 interferon-induced protein 44-like [Mya arenaria]XP_052787781.1 interferon-induced protein 44-like [Mya arenaria]XP_052787782.1 interferon-induced protein 44-like [Mya arenaria]
MKTPQDWLDYGNKGVLSKGDIMNNDLHVTELEVYKVTEQLQALTPAPWRKIKEESLEAQSELIGSLKPCKEQGVSDFRVLLLGPTGSGKSSFVNTVRSTFMGRLSQKAACGLGPRGCTLAYTPYTVQTKDRKNLSLRLCDTPGLTENLGIVDVAFLLGGHVKDHHKFFAANQIDVESSDFVQKPQPRNKIHSVVFVLSVSDVNDPSTGLFEKLMEIKTMLNGKGIPYNTVLTKIDEVCENTEDIYKCAAVGEVVEKVAVKLGVSRNTVFPVKNYENEVELDEHVGALALISLKHILYSAADASDAESAGETTESDVI